MAVVPLTSVRAGVIARLYESRLDPDCRASLRALGLIDASLLRVCKDGDPYIVEVRATRIGLSRRVARRVFVTVGDDDGPA
jgi:Fe2+ transport system protein FeoA